MSGPEETPKKSESDRNNRTCRHVLRLCDSDIIQPAQNQHGMTASNYSLKRRLAATQSSVVSIGHHREADIASHGTSQKCDAL